MDAVVVVVVVCVCEREGERENLDCIQNPDIFPGQRFYIVFTASTGVFSGTRIYTVLRDFDVFSGTDPVKYSVDVTFFRHKILPRIHNYDVFSGTRPTLYPWLCAFMHKNLP